MRAALSLRNLPNPGTIRLPGFTRPLLYAVSPSICRLYRKIRSLHGWVNLHSVGMGGPKCFLWLNADRRKHFRNVAQDLARRGRLVKSVKRQCTTVIIDFRCCVIETIITFFHLFRAPKSRVDSKPNPYEVAADFGRQEKEPCEKRYRCAFSLIGAVKFLTSYFYPPSSTAWRNEKAQQ